MMSTSQIGDNSSAARVSILARMVPVISLCLPLIGEALCAVLLMGTLEAMRSAEMAGIAAVTGGMAEANLAMTIALYVGVFVEFIGIVVMLWAPILLIASFIPLPSIFRARQKWAPSASGIDRSCHDRNSCRFPDANFMAPSRQPCGPLVIFRG